MAQLNLHVKPDFERELARFMRLRGLRTKSEAIRVAVRESLERARGPGTTTSFRSWVGSALAVKPNASPRFGSDDDLWQSDDGD